MPEQDAVWICLVANGAFRHGEKGAVEREVSSVFGADLLAHKAVRGESMGGQAGEYYLFVRCRNWGDHSERLERSAALSSAVPSYASPHHFTEREIRAFAESAEEERPCGFRKGDMVLVKEGYLRNLFGVVEGQTSAKRCRVAFSFHLRKFSESIPVTWLKLVANIFDRGTKAPGRELGKLAKHHHLRGEKG